MLTPDEKNCVILSVCLRGEVRGLITSFVSTLWGCGQYKLQLDTQKQTEDRCWEADKAGNSLESKSHLIMVGFGFTFITTDVFN